MYPNIQTIGSQLIYKQGRRKSDSPDFGLTVGWTFPLFFSYSSKFRIQTWFSSFLNVWWHQTETVQIEKYTLILVSYSERLIVV